MTPEMQDLIRRRIEQMRAMLANLPAEQRAVVEAQIESLGAKFGSAASETAAVLFGKPSGGTGEKHLTYRGHFRAAAGAGGALVFVTEHPEGQPTALFRLDADALNLTEQPLPCGGVALAVDGDHVYVAGTDRRVYVAAGATPKPLAGPFDAPLAALVVAAGDRLAVLSGANLHLVSRADGKVLQTLDLPDRGTCLAADRSGQWLAAGTEKGTVVVFDGQDRADFERSDAERLHDGAVTALLFEPDDLRFFSAGADHKLLSTHARGRLEPEDKGRDNNHEDIVTAMLLTPTGDRLITGARDAALKTWPRAGAVKPAALKDGVGKVVALAVVTVYNQPRLAVACDDDTMRFVELDADGRFGAAVGRVYGAVDRAKHEAGQHDPKRREKALRDAAAWADVAGLDLIAARLDADVDHQLRLLAAQLLAASPNPRAVALLEAAVRHKDEKVRVEAFRGLQTHLGADTLKPIDLALTAGKPDVGVLAVAALGPLAARDDQALARLTDALDHAAWDVRKAALAALEAVFPAPSPEAGLAALGSKHGDVRAAALVRFFERGQLADPRATAAVRRRLEDDDSGVRRVAFLVTVLARPTLARALRAADDELHRQLAELDKAEKPAAAAAALDAADYDVPLQATAARAVDTCLRGARALATLGDARAFGLLIQLSREESAAARVDVCRALATLNDPRAAARLRSLLFDPDTSVRDAAYTALARIEAAAPLAVAESGLTAAAEDVRRRGLQTLVEVVRRDPPGGPPDAATSPAWALLARALDDDAPAVRTEAWKAVLKFGAGEAGLRFARGSANADVRREVLTEAAAAPDEPWAPAFVLDFFNDPDPALRAEAFAHATRKTKELTPLSAALASRFADTRRAGIDALEKKHSKPAQALLVWALADTDRDNRVRALNILIDEDARDSIAEALSAVHDDIRANAAAALARQGHPAALAPLLALAGEPEPAVSERVGRWKEVVEAALGGLEELADPAALPVIRPLLESNHPTIRAAAAVALAAATRPGTADVLRAAMSHPDTVVRHAATLGLARLGDASVVGRLLASDLPPGPVLRAAVALGTSGERVVAVMLDHANATTRTSALLVEMLSELRGQSGDARRCLECLSAKAPRTRLAGARGLELYPDPAAFRSFVVELVNDRGDEEAWKIPAETVETLAAVLVGGSPALRARAVGQFQWLDHKEQVGWNYQWEVFAKRFAADIAAAEVTAPPRTASRLSAAEAKELAFGAYIGLVREQGSATATPAVARVRQTALARVLAVAAADAAYRPAAFPVLMQALADPNQPVRFQAFDQLLALGFARTRLGAEALEAGHTDLGVKGLELLSGGTSTADGDAVLERVLLTRTDDLAAEAAKLLAARRGLVPVAAAALAAAHDPLRRQAVQWLAGEYDQAADARQALRAALRSRYRSVREAAAFELAAKRDAAAFDALVALLRDAGLPGQQTRLIEAIQQLNDPRAAAAFLYRIETDPAGTAPVFVLFTAAGAARRPEVADRLFDLAARRKEWRTAAFDALLVTSGFDQLIDDPSDERPDRTWEEKQHPRHPALLARLLDRAVAAGADVFVAKLLHAARWCRGPEVDEPLALLTANPDPELRRTAVEALGWRFKHRGAPAEALLRALKHKDATTQFLAAEGLARGGRADGISILLSAIEYLDDVGERARAVLALGELGDARALDVLLRLAGEDGHALQEPAAEAIGHLRRSPDAEKIGRLLERLAKGSGGVALRALVGLRWFDSASGWQLIRRRATDRQNLMVRLGAVPQLGFKDEPANRDLLLKLLRTGHELDVLQAAFRAARRLFGAGSLEPHYALVQHEAAADALADADAFGEDVMGAVTERGDVLRLLDIFPRCGPEVQASLEASLLSRAAIPTADARAALASTNEGTVRLAARLLGNAGAPDAATTAALAAALTKWTATWDERRTKPPAGPVTMYPPYTTVRPDATDESVAAAMAPTADALRALVWAACRLGATDRVAELAVSRPDDPLFRPVRHDAVRALAAAAANEAVLAAMDALARGNDPVVRESAAAVLTRHDPARAAALLQPLASDRPSFTRLVAGRGLPAAAAFVRGAVAQVHTLAVALPAVVAAKDVAALAAVAKDRKKPEAARLGAIEGLGVMAAPPAEAVLAEMGAADGDDEDVRKAAWRALRRSKRARHAAEATA
ncbi:HEAT repeat domain-containing protein [Urbifossiella limnaea]|uniref:HEAT repeat protein n=1 Tax=Urbifossiella limnaea TaxID=2528023 RepID=A0A517XWJ9_9BACT|nr:HEAT repeat domain-containing protein [Urbifossiella limnaea]QDU21891.1 HEAT repeat protein [Urbifossiella limnaea]